MGNRGREVGRARREELRRLRRSLTEAQAGLCFWCRRRMGGDRDLRPTLDHLLPRCKGGRYEAANLVAACRACNGRRGGMSVDEWKAAAGIRWLSGFAAKHPRGTVERPRR